MAAHRWKQVATEIGTEECERCGTRVYNSGGVWQRKKGAHWRRIASEPVQECADSVRPSAETKALQAAWAALDALPNHLKQATEAGTALHNIGVILAERGVKV